MGFKWDPPQRTDGELIESGLSVLAAYDPDAADRLEDAYDALGHDPASRADLIEDLVQTLYEHDEHAAETIEREIG